MFYSTSTGGFYSEDIHGARFLEFVAPDPVSGETLDRWSEPNPNCMIPADAIEITEEQYRELFEGQSQGKRIVADENGFPLLADPPLPTAEDIWQHIKAKRDQLQEAGCPVAGYWFHNDLKSRTQWERMVNRAAGMAEPDRYQIGGVPVDWKTMTGDKVPLTAGLIRQVAEAFELREALIFAAAERHNAALHSLATGAEIAAYDHSVGWPQSYAEWASAQP